VVRDLKALKYNFGWDWLPHDAKNANPQTGTNAYTTLKRLGRRVKPPMERTDPEARIKAARMMFPRVYIDNSTFKRETGFLGGARLIECLKHYRRNVPVTTGEPGAPKHDQYSHGCFVAGTIVKTERGDVLIESVKVGDAVWTPAGYSRVLASGPVKTTNDLVEVCVGASSIVCTPEHKFLTNRGFVRADALRYTDRVFSGREWQCILIGLYSRVVSTGFRANITGEMSGARKVRRIFTERFGKTRTDLSQKTTTSTTKTATNRMIARTILNTRLNARTSMIRNDMARRLKENAMELVN
jgi:hypothetical protein